MRHRLSNATAGRQARLAISNFEYAKIKQFNQANNSILRIQVMTLMLLHAHDEFSGIQITNCLVWSQIFLATLINWQPIC